MTMTSVLGHLISHDFTTEYNDWKSVPPESLFEAPIQKYVTPDMSSIKANLETEARKSGMLIIWTDCDREGENIGAEIVEICCKANPKLDVYRARFSAVNNQEIYRAIRTLDRLDYRKSEAVEARLELDLRIGASFTRLQTLHIQQLFPSFRGKVISYGPCQFPTLGFVVDQYLRMKNFVPEPFWNIECVLKKEEKTVNLSWKNGHLFDQLACLILYVRMTGEHDGVITAASTSPTSKWRPLPLRTVELQKFGASYLKIPSYKIMSVSYRLIGRLPRLCTTKDTSAIQEPKLTCLKTLLISKN